MNPKKTKKNENLWAGRFTSAMDPDMEKLSRSLHFDKKIYAEDIKGSIAQAHALLDAGVISPAECRKIESGLRKIKKDLDRGDRLFQPHDEDIHMAVERILTERIGPAGKKLHTGRSRNDQVATDMKLHIIDQCDILTVQVQELQKNILKKAEEYRDDVMPGYTHLQQAQPVSIGHYLLSFFWALERDKSRLNHARKTADEMPLGAGALAGSGFTYDRKKIAAKLGFSRISANSIDATAHRDFIMELLSALAILGSLLSRYAEDFVIWSTQEFGFIELGEGLSTGSSMMPQKRNPDSMELIRGKTGRLLGNLCSMYTAVKGAPMCYSRDLQEDKEPLFDSVETLKVSLSVMAKAMKSLIFDTEIINSKMESQILATDLADYLTESGIPFRESHHLVGELVKNAEKAGCAFTELPDNYWTVIPNGIKIRKKLTFSHSLARHSIQGGTGRKSVKRQLAQAKKILRSAGAIDR